ncbi:MAG: two-component system response regulator CreB [Bacteroidota bacterium]
MKRILVIEDEPSILDNITYALRTEGFEPLCCGTGKDAIKILKENDISLIILDIGLPDITGFELLSEIRKKSTTPVIIVTARSDEIDRIVGLEIGADDYVVKPFSPRELTARVRAVLRRFSPKEGATEESKIIGNSPFQLDEKRFSIRYYDKQIEFSRYEYRLLRILVSNPGRVYTREQLMDRISDNPEMSFDRSIDTHIKTIRQKLKAIKPDDDPIITHRGLGYSLKEL